MSEPDWKTELRSELDDVANDIERGNRTEGGVDYARRSLTDTVFEAVEAAYKRGHEAGSSKAGYRLVQENERLRRQLREIRGLVTEYREGESRGLMPRGSHFVGWVADVIREEDPCSTDTATAGGRTPASRTDETPEGAAP